jgi:hypothetical protein
MPENKIEQWMRDAVNEICDRCGIGVFDVHFRDRMAMVVVAHAPQDESEATAKLLAALRVAEKALERVSDLPTRDYKEAGMDCGNSGDVYDDGYEAGLRAASSVANTALSTLRPLLPDNKQEANRG